MRPYGYIGTLNSFAGTLAVFFLGCLLCFGLVAMCTSPEVETELKPVDKPIPVELCYIDTSDSLAMHALGLPTEVDVRGWHLFGRWGYYQDGEFVLHESIPGDCEAWDELYNLDPDSPNYRFPEEA